MADREEAQKTDHSVRGRFKKAASLLNFGRIRRGMIYLKRHGISRTVDKIIRCSNALDAFRLFARHDLFSADELKKQKEDIFPRDILFSIIVPVYNTPQKYLREMIASVQAQTYGRFELCLADGSDKNHADVGRTCRAYAAKDPRVKYKKLSENFGISGNTNECLKMSTGDYIALFDHDDLLHPAALHEVMKAVCEGNADFVYTDEAIFDKTTDEAELFHFKPDYAPDTLLANNYICHLTVFSRELLEKVGGFRSKYDGSQDHDLILRATDNAHCIAHIPEVLYYWRRHRGSVAADIETKSYAITAGKAAVSDFLRAKGIEAEVSSTEICPTIYRVRYALKEKPLVSVIIPNCEHRDVLQRCIDSILEKTTYPNYEILIVENNSRSPELFAYYEALTAAHKNIRVLTYEGGFNYPAINNFAVKQAQGEVLLLLNNDTEVITPSWIEEMLVYALRPDVGAVGVMLYYPNDIIQHAGTLLGAGGVGAHYFPNMKRNEVGYMGRLCYAQDLTAVTAACLMISRSAWDKVGGLDEAYAVAFNDVDLCMKLRAAGYLNVWTPFTELYHHESLSRGFEDAPEKQARFNAEAALFMSRWQKELELGDPYYNPNLILHDASFLPDLRPEPHAARYTVKDTRNDP